MEKSVHRMVMNRAVGRFRFLFFLLSIPTFFLKLSSGSRTGGEQRTEHSGRDAGFAADGTSYVDYLRCDHRRPRARGKCSARTL